MGEVIRHFARFNAVSAAGIVVQAGIIAALVRFTSLHYLACTLVAVEAAVLHNFFWHYHWTWADRTLRRARPWPILVRFNLTVGAVSLAGNLLFMRLFVGGLRLDPLLAGLFSISACWVMNFLLSDRVVFLRPCRPGSR